MVQVHVSFRTWGFKSLFSHSKEAPFVGASFLFWEGSFGSFEGGALLLALEDL